MSEKKSNSMYEQIELKKVKVNTLAQNCYTRDVVNVSAKAVQQPKKYSSLEEIKLPNGLVYELVEKDYPITPESVTSYADGADYRLDPQRAIENAPKRVNLGDVGEVQEFIKTNPMEAVRLYRDIGAKLETYMKQQQQQKEDNNGGSAVPQKE